MIDKIGLKRVLGQRPLLREEIKMWLDVGFYIEPSSLHDGEGYLNTWMLWDYTGNKCPLTRVVGHNLRDMVIIKWENKGFWPAPEDALSDEESSDMIAMEERSKS